MIETKDLLSIEFYKKTQLTGSYRGMHYIIKKEEENDEKFLTALIWPGPYNCASTADSLKYRKNFPFSAESLPLIADYLNEEYESKREEWPTRIY